MDMTELKLLAEAATPSKWTSYEDDRDFSRAATPAAVLAIISTAEAQAARIVELEAITGPAMRDAPTSEQDWEKLSAESAYALIERRADNVWEAGVMMTAWADARAAKQAGPEYEVDPMEVVRTLVCVADEIAAMPEEKRKVCPSPLCKLSPLMIAARNACVERGFTAGGLAIEEGPA